ncbi:MAG: methyl-accepting chemotaxis protein [Janthinobacterium lividum]
MMLINSLSLFTRLLKRPFAALSSASSAAPSTRRDLAADRSADVSHYAAYIPHQTSDVPTLERRVAELSQALAISTQRAGAADVLARQTAELSVSGVRIIDETMATISRTKDEVRSLAELLTLIDGITSRMHLLAWNANAEAAWAGEHDAVYVKLAGDARRLAEEGASTALVARRHINASVGHVEIGVTRAAEASMTFSDVVRSLEQVRNTLSSRNDAPLPAIGLAPSAGGTIG